MVARVVGIKMSADQEVDIARLQANLLKLLNHVSPHQWHWHSWWGRYVRGQATINQNIDPITGLYEVADVGQLPFWYHGYLHQVKPLRVGMIRCHMMILSLLLNTVSSIKDAAYRGKALADWCQRASHWLGPGDRGTASRSPWLPSPPTQVGR